MVERPPLVQEHQVVNRAWVPTNRVVQVLPKLDCIFAAFNVEYVFGATSLRRLWCLDFC